MKALALAIALVLAPLQCGAPPREHPQFEDSPAEAVWDLSVALEASGDAAGRRRALEFLIDRYPSSRFAERARVTLAREAQSSQPQSSQPQSSQPQSSPPQSSPPQ